MKTRDILDFIESKVPGAYFGGYLPPSPDDAIMIHVYGGTPDADLSQLRSPKFQVLVRNANFEDGESQIQAIFDEVHGLDAVQIGGQFVDSVRAQQEPFHIGQDKQNRHNFSVNFEMTFSQMG